MFLSLPDAFALALLSLSIAFHRISPYFPAAPGIFASFSRQIRQSIVAYIFLECISIFGNSSEQHQNEKTDCAGLPAKGCIFILGWAGADRPVDDRLAPTEVERRRPSSLRHMTRKRHIAFEEGGLWPAVLNSYYF
ncbi:MAG: hypothetical protein LUG99_19400 [Lachnospiraceae bacterium]|nr:hypothetical protein [Lachnospiraceae bacterium]